jgi:RNA recognition motif-containing protein
MAPADDENERAFRARVTMQNCVRITNLSPTVTEAALRDHLSARSVTDVRVASDILGACRGFAFVSFGTMDEAEAVRDEINAFNGVWSADITHNGPLSRAGEAWFTA